MRIALAIVVSTLSLALSGCQTGQPAQIRASIQVAPLFQSRAPADLAILPVEDATPERGFAELEPLFRDELSRQLAQRLYTPLAPGYVNDVLAQGGTADRGSPTEVAWLTTLRSRFQEDAILGLRVTRWDVTDLMLSKPKVEFAIELLMLDTETGAELCFGSFEGSLKPGGQGAAEIGRASRTRQSIETLAALLAQQIPERRVRPQGGAAGAPAAPASTPGGTAGGEEGETATEHDG
ncbi:MAG: hypothetical protein IPM29_23625 [Planctomycetes bacterium]|nr:hypothetical protein [Planctomycetota bacterium]